MDFHTLPRRELQALCKRNKIPANLTNIAMADSLKALVMVEGVEEVMQASKSGIAQSSIGPRLRSDAPSPCVNMTPVPSGLTSRRRIAAKGDSAVTGTRWSARLAKKSGSLLKGVEFGSVYSRKDLFTGDSINLEDSLDSLDEMSGVTDMEGCEKKDEEQVHSADKQNVSTDVEPEATIEDESTERLTEKEVVLIKVGNDPDPLKKDCSTDDFFELLKKNHDGSDKIVGVTGSDENSEKNSEAQLDSSEKQDMSIDEYLEPSVEDDEGGNMEVKEQGDGSQSFALAGVIANTQVEFKSAEKNDSEVEKVEFANQSCVDAGSEEVSLDDDETFDNEDSNPDEDTDLEQDSTDSSETESDTGEPDSIILERTEESTKANDSFDCLGSEISSIMSYKDDNKVAKSDLAIEEAGFVQPVANAPASKNTTTFMENDSSFITQPLPLLTPQRASSAIRYSRRSRITAASDNKENIGSGSKTAPAKERPKTVKEIAVTVPMFDPSLIKNLKDLQITNKSDKNEGETEAFARTALQALPQNKT